MSTALGYQRNHCATFAVATVTKSFATITSAVSYTLIYAVFITIAVLIQNSAYYLTPLAVRLSEKLGLKAEMAGESCIGSMQHQRIHNLFEREEKMFRTSMNTIIVAFHVSVLITLALWVGARFGVGITVKMSPVKFGWHDMDGGQKLAFKEEHVEGTGTPR